MLLSSFENVASKNNGSNCAQCLKHSLAVPELRGSSLQLFAEHSMLRMFLGISLCCLLVKPLTASSIVKEGCF